MARQPEKTKHGEWKHNRFTGKVLYTPNEYSKKAKEMIKKSGLTHLLRDDIEQALHGILEGASVSDMVACLMEAPYWHGPTVKKIKATTKALVAKKAGKVNKLTGRAMWYMKDPK